MVIGMNVPDTLDNADLCLCSSCPTRNECMRQHEQRLFCARGKQTATVRVKGVAAADV
jgi:positive regulator of sigma E activity